MRSEAATHEGPATAIVLHACCGPCASACVTRLKEAGYAVTLLFANSNIDTAAEFARRQAAAEALARAEGVPFAALPYVLVDLDSQGNASRGLGIDALSLPQTVYDVLLGEIDTSLAIRKTGEKGLDILPSNLKLANLDLAIQSKNVSKPFFLLRSALSKVKDQYDYILIDCPPSLGLLNINAFAAASSVLIPVQCEFFAMEGVAAILSSINKIQNDFNPSLKIEGFLLTMYDSRNSLDTEIMHYLDQP